MSCSLKSTKKWMVSQNILKADKKTVLNGTKSINRAQAKLRSRAKEKYGRLPQEFSHNDVVWLTSNNTLGVNMDFFRWVDKVSEETPKEIAARLARPLYMSKSASILRDAQKAEEAKTWWDNSPLSKFIAYEELFDVVNSTSWGQFKDGAITLFKGADHTVLYHEAFHAFTQNFLTLNDKTRLYKEASKTLAGQKAIKAHSKSIGVEVKDMSESDKALALEELMAEDFRQYMIGEGSKVLESRPARNSIFRRIMDFLNRLFQGATLTELLTGNGSVYIQDIYEKMRVGDISGYTNSNSNAYFGNTLHSLKPVAGVSEKMQEQDVQLITRSMNSLALEFIEDRNKELGENLYSGTISTDNVAVISEMFQYIKNDFSDLIKDKLEEITDEKNLPKEDSDKELIAELQEDVSILQAALDNFGDTEEGFVELFLNKGDFLSKGNKVLDKDVYKKTEEDTEVTKFDKSGNGVSIMGLASKPLLQILKTLKEYDQEGEVAVNRLGYSELMPSDKAWAILITLMVDKANSIGDVRDILLKNSKEYPWMVDLIERLGSFDLESSDVRKLSLWTQAWQKFAMMTKVKMLQILNKQVEIEDESPAVGFQKPNEKAVKIETRAMTIKPSVVKAKKDFKSNFSTAKDLPYVKREGSIGNVLNMDVIEAHSGYAKNSATKLAFLKDIGFNLTGNRQLMKDLESLDLDFIYQKLIDLRKFGSPVTDVIKALESHFVIEGETKADNVYIKSSASDIAKILELEISHSKRYANNSVLDINGNLAFEESQMASAMVIARAINNVKNWNELMQIESMDYLSEENNHFFHADLFLKSLFKYENGVYGDRIEGAYIDITQFEGSSFVLANDSTIEKFTKSSSNTDRFSHTIEDILMVVDRAIVKTPQHGDKNMVFGYGLTQVNNKMISDPGNKYFIDPINFITRRNGSSNATRQIHELLKPYIQAEIERMKRIKSGAVPSIPGVTVADKEGNIRGSEFAIFDKIFHSVEGLYDKMKEVEDVNNMSSELESEVIQAVDNYFSWVYEKTSDILEDLYVIDDISLGKINDLIDKGNLSGNPLVLNKGEAREIAIGMYVTQKFFTGLGYFSLIAGDISQYNYLKDDVTKRIPAFFATGEFFNTDEVMLDHINSNVRKPFQEKYHKEKGKRYTYVDAGKTMDTAILKENTVKSSLIPQYQKTFTIFFKKKFSKQGFKGEALNKKVSETVRSILDSYYKMDEADAQGYLTLDMYRILSIESDKWLQEHEDLFQKILKGETISPYEIKEFFPPRKFQYAGWLKMNGYNATAFHKYSLFPLIPTSIEGTNLQDVNEMLMEQDFGYATFQSGSKLATIVKKGTNSADKIYSDDEGPRSINKGLAFTKNTIYLSYLKNQLDVNSSSKGKTIFSTQMRAIAVKGLSSQGKPIDFVGTKEEWESLSNAEKIKTSEAYNHEYNHLSNVEQLTKFRRSELLNEIGWTENDIKKENKDMTKFVEFLNKEFSNDEKVSDHAIEFIKSDEKGKLVHDLSISLNSNMIENAIMSIINNRVVRQKVNGEPLVQLSTTFFESRGATAEENKKHQTNDLSGYMNPGLHTHTIDLLSKKTAKENRDKIYVFGDNLIGKGKKGQAVIRDEENAFGIPTKKNPGTAKEDYFTDSEIEENKKAIDLAIEKILKQEKEVVFPKDGIGTGLAKLKTKAPSTYKYLVESLEDNFGFDNKGNVDKTTRPVDIKIALQGDYLKLLDLEALDGGPIKEYDTYIEIDFEGNEVKKKKLSQEKSLIKLNALIKDKNWRKKNIDMISLVGVRIPVQDDNSIESMAVWEFLPAETGNVVILPSEIVAKSGGDFDVDKLTIYLPHIASIPSGVYVPMSTSVMNVEKQRRSIERNKVEIASLKEEISILNDEATENIKAIDDSALENEYLEEIKLSKDYYNDLERKIIFDNKFKTKEEKESALSDFYDQKNSAFKELGRSIRGERIEDASKAKEIQAKSERLESLQRRNNSLSASGFENNLLFGIRDIMLSKFKFISLITPNSTEIFTGENGVVTSLAQKKKNDPREGVDGKARDYISPTSILEPVYNIGKYEGNIDSKNTLSIAAVANKFNPIFNSVGMHIADEYTLYKTEGEPKESDIITPVLRFDHNTIKYKGSNVISLSGLYDAHKENSIGEVNSQMMNGFLDAAKDAWVFDMNGNVVVIPVIDFLNQAGVPIRDIAYFVTNPIVSKYVLLTKKLSSPYAVTNGLIGYDESPEKKALEMIFEEYHIAPFKNKTQRIKAGFKNTKKINSKDSFDLYSNGINESNINFAKESFLHYLAINDLAQDITNIKTAFNYDTKRSNSIFESAEREERYNEVMESSSVPEIIKHRILGETIIGSFKINDLQKNVAASAMPLMNDGFVNNFLIKTLSDFDEKERLKKMFGTVENFAREYKNGLVVKIFEDAIKQTSVKGNRYRGIEMKNKIVTRNSSPLFRGAEFKEDKNGKKVLYIDRDIINLQLDQLLYSEDIITINPRNQLTGVVNLHYGQVGLAPVDVAAFSGETKENDFFNFVIEREYLRTKYSFTKLAKSSRLKSQYEKNINNTEQGVLTDDEFAEAMLRQSYEEVLRDMALENTYNFWKLFSSENSYADQFFEFTNNFNHPELQNLSLVANMTMSEGGNKNETIRYKNLKLNTNRIDADAINVYHQNINILSDPNTIPLDNVEDSEENEIERDLVSQFFSKISFISMIQSGLNTSDELSLAEIVPQEKIALIIEEGIKKNFSNNKTLYMNNFMYKFEEQNNRSKVGSRRRLKDYATQSLDDLTRNLTKDGIQISKFVEISGHDSSLKKGMEVDLILNGEKTGATIGFFDALDIKKGDIIKIEDGNKEVLVKATSDAYSVTSISKEKWSKLEGLSENTYDKLSKEDSYQFTFEKLDSDFIGESQEKNINVNVKGETDAEVLVRNNPNVIFVFEANIATKDLFITRSGEHVKVNKLRKHKNVMPIYTEGALNGAAQLEMVTKSMAEIKKMYKTDKKFVFLPGSKDHGSFMLADQNIEAYEAMVNLLNKDFNYNLKSTKLSSDVQMRLISKQSSPETDLVIPADELSRVREEMENKCNL